MTWHVPVALSVSSASGSSWRSETCLVSSSSRLLLLVVGHLHPLDVEIERLAGEQALAPAVPVVELDEVLGVELGAHQLLLHRPLGLARGVEREAVVLVVEARDLALHPEIELLVGELVVQELIDLLGVVDLLSGCSGTRGGRSARRSATVRICRPICISSCAARLYCSSHSSARRSYEAVARRHAGLVLSPTSDVGTQDLGGDFARIRQLALHQRCWNLPPNPQKCRLMPKSGMKVSTDASVSAAEAASRKSRAAGKRAFSSSSSFCDQV